MTGFQTDLKLKVRDLKGVRNWERPLPEGRGLRPRDPETLRFDSPRCHQRAAVDSDRSSVPGSWQAPAARRGHLSDVFWWLRTMAVGPRVLAMGELWFCFARSSSGVEAAREARADATAGKLTVPVQGPDLTRTAPKKQEVSCRLLPPECGVVFTRPSAYICRASSGLWAESELEPCVLNQVGCVSRMLKKMFFFKLLKQYVLTVPKPNNREGSVCAF